MVDGGSHWRQLPEDRGAPVEKLAECAKAEHREADRGARRSIRRGIRLIATIPISAPAFGRVLCSALIYSCARPSGGVRNGDRRYSFSGWHP
jgi:hypothetical protein